jgi:DNA-binding NtrC family response regulator
MNDHTSNRDKQRLLIVDDERIQLNVLNNMLKANYLIKVATNGQQAIDRAINDPQPDLILLDINLPDMNGFQVLERLKLNERSKNIPVIFLTAMNSEEDETKGLEMGAVDYITKPFSPAIVNSRIKTHLNLIRSMREMMEAQLQTQSLQKQVSALNRSLAKESLKNPEAFSEIISNSAAMLTVFHYMEAIADSGEAILITGETGAGKELIAQGVHNLGQRTGKLISVNLAGLDDVAFSDTLFGHTKGAFTGANQAREGFISQADGGTLFLDEIGDLVPASQIKLLRLLQEKTYYPLGSDTPKTMNVTVVAATHRNLQEMMKNDLFRPDLYYRLSSHHIKLPSLRYSVKLQSNLT